MEDGIINNDVLKGLIYCTKKYYNKLHIRYIDSFLPNRCSFSDIRFFVIRGNRIWVGLFMDIKICNNKIYNYELK
jgi:hypothetical protein